MDSWIGLSDTATEGTFMWVSGNELSFGKTVGQTPWSSGEPNVYTFIQHFQSFNSMLIFGIFLNSLTPFSYFVFRIMMVANTVYIQMLMERGMIINVVQSLNTSVDQH